MPVGDKGLCWLATKEHVVTNVVLRKEKDVGVAREEGFQFMIFQILY